MLSRPAGALKEAKTVRNSEALGGGPWESWLHW